MSASEPGALRAPAGAVRLALAGWLLAAGLWALELTGLFESHALARGVVLLAVAATIAVGVLYGLAVWRAPAGPARRHSLALAAVLVLAVVVRFVGLDFELMDHPVGDEGVFHEVSQNINQGDLFPKTFNYGHFLYYAGALAIWLFELFPLALTRFFEIFYTTVEGYGVQRLLLKSVNAGLSAIAAGAVFGAAYLTLAPEEGAKDAPGEGGSNRALLGATLAGLFIVFSALYNSVAQQLIADVPAAAFAAICLYFVARLTRRERTSDYLLAGVSAGLAAASKYPGGMVAIAILAVWLAWRLRSRSWSWDLLWAALISIGTLLFVMPAFFVHSGAAFRGEGLDLFFGFRQYAFGGWLGVQPDSNLVWYGKEFAFNFGWPALVLALAGLAFLRAGVRWRWLVLGAYPAVYLTLIVSMSMVVHRNLQAVLPAVAILVGVALATTLDKVRQRSRIAFVAGLLAVLALPVFRSAAWSISRTRPGTRQLARAWIEANVPEGASLIRERYTPQVDPERYSFISHRFAAWQDPVEMLDGRWEYLVLARPAYGRFVESEDFRREHQSEYRERYETMLDFPRLVEFEPSTFRAGPRLSIHALEGPETTFLRQRVFLPDEASFLSHPDLTRDGPGKPLQYTKRWQFAVFKDFFEAGEYRVALGMNPPLKEGYLHVIDRRNREVGSFNLLEDFTVELPRPEKYLFRVFLAPPTRLYGLEIKPAGEAGAVSGEVPRLSPTQ